MNDSPIDSDHDEEMFAIDGHAAQHFLAAHLSIHHARICIRCADEACHDDDPDELLHEARIEAAEAQHHITLAAEVSARVNAPHLVIGALGPLLDELERELDAIRYRAHTPFGDNPAWWRDLNLDLSAVPDEFADVASDRFVDQSLLFAEQGPDVTAQLPDHIRRVLPDDVGHKIVEVRRVTPDESDSSEATTRQSLPERMRLWWSHTTDSN